MNTSKVIEIRSLDRSMRAKIASPVAGVSISPHVITQETLRKGIELLAQEWRAVRNMRNFTLQLQRALDAGAEIEDGELTLDAELSIDRRQAMETSVRAK